MLFFVSDRAMNTRGENYSDLVRRDAARYEAAYNQIYYRARRGLTRCIGNDYQNRPAG